MSRRNLSTMSTIPTQTRSMKKQEKSTIIEVYSSTVIDCYPEIKKLPIYLILEVPGMNEILMTHFDEELSDAFEKEPEVCSLSFICSTIADIGYSILSEASILAFDMSRYNNYIKLSPVEKQEHVVLHSRTDIKESIKSNFIGFELIVNC